MTAVYGYFYMKYFDFLYEIFLVEFSKNKPKFVFVSKTNIHLTHRFIKAYDIFIWRLICTKSKTYAGFNLFALHFLAFVSLARIETYRCPRTRSSLDI